MKSEFIKAIISVLRLENNVFITGAIEEITDRLDVSDYKMFIAYLGERNANYEKPIESITKGVDEFYKIKTKKIRQELSDRARILSVRIGSVYDFLKVKAVDDGSDISKYGLDVITEKVSGSRLFSDGDISIIHELGGIEILANEKEFVWVDGVGEREPRYEIILECMIDKAGFKKSIVEKIEDKSQELADSTDISSMLTSVASVKRIGKW